MHDESLAELSIVTSMDRAIEIHSLIKRDLYQIEFEGSSDQQATFYYSADVPQESWWGLFDEVEKQTIGNFVGDQFEFEGIWYRTTIIQALKRILRLVEKIDGRLKQKKTAESRRKLISARDDYREMGQVLSYFNSEDEITLKFIFPEWPDPEKIERRNYVKEFEEKLFNDKQR